MKRGLFDQQEQQARQSALPLAARMRPRTLAEYVGQQHFLGPGKLLRRLLEADRISSVIFYGPPGTGKTSLAELIALHTKRPFERLHGAAIGVKELRQTLDAARGELAATERKTVLFIDELHHLDKRQQDVLLADLEEGVITLIGATTSNPFFVLAPAVISRSQVFEFRPLDRDDLLTLMRRALTEERGLGSAHITITDEALAFLAESADGDARRALSGLEVAVLSASGAAHTIELADAEDSIQKKSICYTAGGDQHYDVTSAFIKSLRGSDPDAALYWLALMLEGGEDPRFIARRLWIAASEDVGNADPQALLIAEAAARAVEFIGLPEVRIVLSQAVAYVALAPKSNAAIQGIDAALADVRTQSVITVPRSLQDAHYRGAERLGHGQGYDNPHSHADGFAPTDYLGVDREYYHPAPRGFEQTLADRLQAFRARRRKTSEE